MELKMGVLAGKEGLPLEENERGGKSGGFATVFFKEKLFGRNKGRSFGVI